MSTSEQQPASATNTAALESTKSTQAGFPFLSLPPEIRNMIYHHVFTPVKDGTCWRIHAPLSGNRLKGVQSTCVFCCANLTHTTCHAEHVPVKDMCVAFDFSGSYWHCAIMQTCNAILKETLPISLASMHISIVYCDIHLAYFSQCLKLLLANMRQPKGAYLAAFTCTYYEGLLRDGDGMGNFSQLINGAGIRIGYLVLCELMYSPNPKTAKCFVTNLDRLENKPAKVEWTQSCGRNSPQYETERRDFNEAAKKWLAQLAKVKADPNARMPLLRDFLPQFFEN